MNAQPRTMSSRLSPAPAPFVFTPVEHGQGFS
jgi:hypothetical protein